MPAALANLCPHMFLAFVAFHLSLSTIVLVSADPGLCGSYYPNAAWTGTPSITRRDPTIDFNWGWESPITGADVFSARWTGCLRTPLSVDSVAEISVLADNLATIRLGGSLLIQTSPAITTYRNTTTLRAGSCTPISIDYVEQGALARLSLKWRYRPTASTVWSIAESVIATNFFQSTCSPPAAPGLCGLYFRRTDWTGNPDLIRRDSTINFNWGSSAPVANFPDTFSVRWTGCLKTPLPVNTFAEITITADNGAAVRVGSSVVIPSYRSLSPARGTVTLQAGACTNLTVDYVELGVLASVSLSWRYRPATSSVWSIPETLIAANFLESTCPPPPPLPASNLDGTGFCAIYYSEPSLTAAVIQRVEPRSEFNWGLGSPIAGVVDAFSAQFRACLKNPFVQGDAVVRLRITPSLGDSVRLFRDDRFGVYVAPDGIAQLTIGQICTPISITFSERYAAASLRIEWAYRPSFLSSLPETESPFALIEPEFLVPRCAYPDSVADGRGVCASYFNNPTFSETPVFTRVEPVFNFTWGSGSPFPLRPFSDPASRPEGADFSARFEACLVNPYLDGAASVNLIITADDSYRLFSGTTGVGALIRPGTRTHGPIWIPSRGCWPIRIDYVETSATVLAAISVSWSHRLRSLPSMPLSPASLVPAAFLRTPTCTQAAAPGPARFLNGTGLCGIYMPNPLWRWDNDVSLKRIEAAMNFNWSLSSPLLHQTDSWSARWEGCIWNPYNSGEATVDFRIVSDGGFKLTLYGNVTVIDTLNPAVDIAQDRVVRVTLPSSKCAQISLEYADHAAAASLSLRWRHVPYGSQLPMPATFTAIPAVNLWANTATCNVPLTYLRRELAGTGICATYFPNQQLLGPLLQRVERVPFAFDWRSGGPLPGIVDRWSVRFQGCIVNPFVAGDALVTFRIDSSDFHQFWLNGVLISDTLTTRQPGTSYVTARLSGSQSCIPFRIEFQDSFDVASFGLTWVYRSSLIPGTNYGWNIIQPQFVIPTGCTLLPEQLNGTGLCGSYFANPTWSFGPSVTRIDPEVKFTWEGRFGRPSPSPFPVRPYPDPKSPVSGFSTRWTGCLINPYLDGDARVTLRIRSNQGHTLYGNGNQLAISQAPAETNSEFIIPSRSCYPIRIDYFDLAMVPGASIVTSWTYIPVGVQTIFYTAVKQLESRYLRPATCAEPTQPRVIRPSGTGLCGTYTPSIDWSWVAETSMKRVDPVVNFTWALSSPLQNQPDRWTARWEGCLWNPYAYGEATIDLRVVTDSKFKLSLYGTVLLNTLGNAVEGPLDLSVRVTLPDRKCSPIVLDYIDVAGSARVSLQWSHIPYASGLPMPAPAVIPSAFLATNVATCTTITLTPSVAPALAPAVAPAPSPSVGRAPSVVPAPTPSVGRAPSVVPAPTPSVGSAPSFVPAPIPSVGPTPSVVPAPTPSVGPAPSFVPAPIPSVGPTPTFVPAPTPSAAPAEDECAGLFGEYFIADRNFDGRPAATRVDRNINFARLDLPSLPSQIPSDDFSVRWTGCIKSPNALRDTMVTFIMEHDDGARILISGNTVLHRYAPGVWVTNSMQILLSSDECIPIEVHYFEAFGGSKAILKWIYDGISAPEVVPSSALVPSSCRPASPSEPDTCRGLHAEYFGNVYVENPVLKTSIDGEIDFNWGLDAPSPIPELPDHFSVRWTGCLRNPTPSLTGRVNITVLSDDGIRVTLGNEVIVDLLQNVIVEREVAVELAADSCTPIEILYAEYEGRARISLQWEYFVPGSGWSPKEIIPRRYLQPSRCPADFPPPLPDPTCSGVRAQYFDLDTNRKLVERLEAGIDLNLNSGEIPDAIAPQPNLFSIVWTGCLKNPSPSSATQINLTFIVDDGLRFWLNDQLLLNQWGPQSTTTYSVPIEVQGDTCTPFRVQYRQVRGRAVARMLWAYRPASGGAWNTNRLVSNYFLLPDKCSANPVPPSAPEPTECQGLQAEYFNNTSFLGSPIATPIEQYLNISQAVDQPPVALVPFGISTQYSVRWSGCVQNPLDNATADVEFTVNSDDGIRITLGGELLLEDWTPHPPRSRSASAVLSAQSCTPILIEFYQNFGLAQARLTWKYRAVSSSDPMQGPYTVSFQDLRVPRCIPAPTPVFFSPVASPTASPVASPTASPVASPVASPTAPPVVPPISSPVASPLAPEDGLCAQYFANTDLSGASAIVIDRTVDLALGPDETPPSLPGEKNFSVRWRGCLRNPSGAGGPDQVKITFVADDGVRISLGSERIVDDWVWTSATARNATVLLPRDSCTPIVIEYFDGSDQAIAKLMWSYGSVVDQIIPPAFLSADSFCLAATTPVASPGDSPTAPPDTCSGLTAQYFANTDLTGARVSVIDRTIDFSLGLDESPSALPGERDFSVRWTGCLKNPSGASGSDSVNITFVADDGVRITLGGERIIDDWVMTSARPRSAPAVLLADSCTPIVIEYFDGYRHAVARLMWSYGFVLNQVIPATFLRTSTCTASAPYSQTPSTSPATPTASPSVAPIVPPVAAPRASPTAAPVTSPVAAPVASPVAAPVASPVVAPVASPVAAPVASPVAAPVASPVAVPVASPVVAPVASPVAAPVASPVATPVAPPITVPAPVSAPTCRRSGVWAEYWNNTALLGVPAVVRVENQVLFQWGGGRPAGLNRVDNFTARMETCLTNPLGDQAASVMFRFDADDGIRVKFNNELIIDDWFLSQDDTIREATVTIPPSSQTPCVPVQIEFIDRSNVAFLFWFWSYAPASGGDYSLQDIVPSDNLEIDCTYRSA